MTDAAAAETDAHIEAPDLHTQVQTKLRQGVMCL